MLNLAVMLEDSAREVPDRIAVIFNDTKLTYAQVNARPTRSPMGWSPRASVGATRWP